MTVNRTAKAVTVACVVALASAAGCSHSQPSPDAGVSAQQSTDSATEDTQPLRGPKLFDDHEFIPTLYGPRRER
jgi:hypothetical protein